MQESLASPPSPLMHLDFPNMRETYPGTLDIYFLFHDEETGEESKLAAHKLLLAMSSEVFMNQFFTQFAEATQGTVNITDSSFHSFKIFLDHIYGIKIPWSDLSHSTLYQLFHLANKYQIGSLAQCVCKWVSEMQVTCENVLDVASIALCVMSINAEHFSESLCASVQYISVDKLTLALNGCFLFCYPCTCWLFSCNSRPIPDNIRGSVGRSLSLVVLMNFKEVEMLLKVHVPTI